MQISSRRVALIPMDVLSRLHSMFPTSGRITVRCRTCTLMDTKWHPIQSRKFEFFEAIFRRKSKYLDTYILCKMLIRININSPTLRPVFATKYYVILYLYLPVLPIVKVKVLIFKPITY